MNRIETEALVVAKHLGIDERVQFSDRLQWVKSERGNHLVPVRFRAHPGGRIVVYTQALRGDVDPAAQLLRGLRWCREQVDGGRWADGGSEDGAAAGLRTLYVSRPLLNADELLAWARSEGFTGTLDASDLHVTIAFSKQLVDWDLFEPEKDKLFIGAPRNRVMPLGNEGAMVLKFESVELMARWRRFCEGGASWDWPEYQPHVTIAYDSEIDPTLVGTYDGDLVFGPEQFAEIDENWRDRVKEWDESEHPRDEDGKFADGGGGSDESSGGSSLSSSGNPHNHESLSGKGTVVHSKDLTPEDEQSPSRMQIIHDPSTGTKKPFEIWAGYKSGKVRRLSNFKTEAAALASFWWKDKEWDESEHPRDEDGKFTFSGGGDDEEAIPAADEASAAAQATPAGTDVGATSGKPKSKVSDFTGKVKLNHEGVQAESFIQDFDKRFSGTPEQFRRAFTGQESEITMSKGVGGKWYLQGHVLDDKGSRVARYERSIDFAEKKASSDYFAITNRSDRASGIGKKMLAANVETYKQLGIDKVEVHANIDVGGYAWAKYGYIPNRDSWRSLSAYIERQLTGSGGSRSVGGDDGETYTPESWDMIGETERDRIRDAWMEQTRSEFLDSEIESWRENGDAEKDAARQVAEDGAGEDWVRGALERDYTFRGEEPQDGKIALPFTADEIMNAIDLEYEDESRSNNWKGAVRASFDDGKLNDASPEGYDEHQPTLPGIQALQPKDYLSDERRDEIIEAVEVAAVDRVERIAGDMEAPEWLADNVRESQESYWDDSVDDDYRYNWAERNGELPSYPIESDDEEDAPEPVDMPADENAALLKLARSSDPRAVWAIADSPKGKELLLNSDWYGTLNLNDKQSMDRFEAYVGKTPSKKAA